MIRLTRLALRYRTVTLLAVVLLILGGILAVGGMTQELFPSLDAPYLVITATEPGAGPNVVDQNLAAPIEGVLTGTENLVHAQTQSLEGMVVVTAQYEFGTNMDDTEATVLRALNQVSFPDGVAAPQVQRVSPGSLPIYELAVSGDDQDAVQAFVASKLTAAVTGVSGVASVDVAGVTTQDVMVTLDLPALSESGVTLTDVSRALVASNVSVPVGLLTSGEVSFPVRVSSTVSDLDAIRAIPVLPDGAPGSTPVPLGELGTVSLASGGTGSTISRLDGEPAVTLSVTKTQDANTVRVVGNIEDEIATLDVPSGIRIETTVNQAPEVQKGVSDLARDAAIGILLAVVAVLLFLGSLRGTLVSGMSIPLSLLVGLMLMRADHISLNILTLGALSVASGRVIDDAIVVLENIHRLLDEGLERTEAVIVGTTQMVPPITASTITTVAVFLPLAFVGGLVGAIFVGFALTVTFAMGASLLVAVTIVPVLAQSFLRPSHGRNGADGAAGSEPALRRAYRRPLRWALAHRWTVVVSAVVLLVLSIGSLQFVPSNLFPSSAPSALQTTVSAPPGTSLQATADQVAGIEQAIAQMDGVDLYTTVVGSTPGGLGSVFGGGTGSSNSAVITLSLGSGADADKLTAQVEQAIAASGLFGSVTAVESNGPSSSNVTVEVTGDDFAAVSDAAAAVVERLGTVDGLAKVTSNVATGRQELVIDVDRQAAAAVGLDASTIAAIVRAQITPTPVTTTVVDGAPVQVVVATTAAGAGPDDVAALTIAPGVTLGDVATVGQADSPAAVTRYDGARSAEVTGTITSDNLSAVVSDIDSALADLQLPAGVEATQGGAAEMFSESFGALGTAIMIAAALVYLAMVATFGSLVTPLVIMFTLPLAAIGAFPALWVTGRALSLTALLGLLMLIGIVVTNAIVMLEFVERLKREKSLTTYDAIVEGASIRLRPILMTAIVTMVALIPLALGLSEGALLSTSLATVVIGGLFSSTLLTLFVIPCVYSLIDGMRSRLGRRALVEEASPGAAG